MNTIATNIVIRDFNHMFFICAGDYDFYKVNKVLKNKAGLLTGFINQICQSVRDLQDSSGSQMAVPRESPGTPSDLYLQGLSVRR